MSLFAINYDADTPQPQDVQYEERPVVGTTIDGDPVIQGYEAIVAVYTHLPFADMAILKALYDPAHPTVVVTYDDPDTGASVTRNGKMHPPKIGGVYLDLWKGVSVRFSRLTPIDES